TVGPYSHLRSGSHLLKEDDVLKTLSRSMFVVLFAAFVAAGISTVVYGQATVPQTATNATPPATTPARPAPPPDQAAYTAANAMKDPAEKLAALRKFKTDFASSIYSTSAD